ncbi:MAG: hypothetical protein ACJ8J7_04835, partial [Sulfurifustaceae bacterium]
MTRLVVWVLLLTPASWSLAATRELPDFAGLVAQHGGEVVNISTSQARREPTEWNDNSPDSAPPEGSGTPDRA